MKLLERKVSLKGAEAVAASVSTIDVEREFYEQVALGERYWWWVQLVLLDPNELIVDDANGGLFRVPYTAANNTITFGDPVAVNLEFVDKPTQAALAAAINGIAATRGDKVAAKHESRDESRHFAIPTEGGSMDLLTKLRGLLGLAEDATEEQIEAEAATRLAAASADAPEPVAEDAPVVPVEPAAAPAGSVAAAAGAVLVDPAQLAQLQADASAGRLALTRQIEAEDRTVLSAAVASGKFPPARVPHFAALLKADREGTTALIEQLAENVVPIEAKGKGEGKQEAEGSVGYPVGWAPDVAARAAELRAATSRPRITLGG